MSVKVLGTNISTQQFPHHGSAVSAGFSTPIEEFSHETLSLNELLIKHPSATFFMQVEGNSMIEANIQSGDIVIVDRALQAHHGSIVIAVVRNELLIKRLERIGSKWQLASANPAFAPIVIDDEIDGVLWGIVTFVIHKM